MSTGADHQAQDGPPRPTDAGNDFDPDAGLHAFRETIGADNRRRDSGPPPPVPTTEDRLAFLARLSEIEYFQIWRAMEAEALGVPLAVLDREVAKRRPKDGNGKQGREIKLPEPEPWPQPVDGAALLNDLARSFARYLALPEGAATTLALWALHTHAIAAADISPRLAITSPEKRCGKSRLLQVLAKLVLRPLLADNVTTAALFRTIEAVHPCLLIDEYDAFALGNDELRGIINSGHTRAGQAIRLVGDDHEPRCFSTCAPVAIALIGRPAATIEDRSAVVPMRRRRPDERIERLTPRALAALEPLARQAARWAADNLSLLHEADPEIPEALHDRAADNWRPLLAIADAAGGGWPARARKAALALSGGQDETSARTTLLADIRAIFAERGTDRLASGDLAAALARMEDRPWPEWRHGKPLSVRQLAKLLHPVGVAPGTIRLPDGSTPKGYHLTDFDDAFARYLPSDPPHRHNPQETAENRGFRSATTGFDVADGKPEKQNGINDVVDVADQIGDSAQETMRWTA